jgi:hypothetical protein
MPKDYRLEVMLLPQKSRSGIYDNIVSEFISGVLDNASQPVKSVKVSASGKQPKTLQIGLAKAVQMAGRKDISVRMVNGEVFLAKK